MAEQKINMEKSITFLYTSNKQLEIEIKKYHLKQQQRNGKYLGITLKIFEKSVSQKLYIGRLGTVASIPPN